MKQEGVKRKEVTSERNQEIRSQIAWWILMGQEGAMDFVFRATGSYRRVLSRRAM